jgi:hypothetical protein
LTDEYWERWCFKWEESGFEIYEGMTPNYMNKEVDNEIGAPIRRKLEIREILDDLLSRYYDLESSTADWPKELQDEAISTWIKVLNTTTGELRNQAVGQLKDYLRPESQNALENSQAQTAQAPLIGRDLTYLIDEEELES